MPSHPSGDARDADNRWIQTEADHPGGGGKVGVGVSVGVGVTVGLGVTVGDGVSVGWDLRLESSVTAPAYDGLLDLNYATPLPGGASG